MDVDAYVAAHRGEWARLEQLLDRHGRLTGAEVDELVELYGRVATHLSVVRSASPDPALVGRLSTLVARARATVTGPSAPALRELGRFFSLRFPAALYRSAGWWAPTGVAFVLLSVLIGWWVAASPRVQGAVATPEHVRRLVEHDFEHYYSAHPATSFAAQVWTNNAWVAALAIAGGVLVVPVLYGLLYNALNVGLTGGLMAAHGRLDLFFGLVTPHGLLELTAVFVAAGSGLRLGWCWVSPGPRTRGQALAQEGRAAAGIALGLVVVLLVSGVIEAFVTPSGLPTWARVGIGVLAEAVFLGYVFVVGRRAARAGETGDVGADAAGATVPYVT